MMYAVNLLGKKKKYHKNPALWTAVWRLQKWMQTKSLLSS